MDRTTFARFVATEDATGQREAGRRIEEDVDTTALTVGDIVDEGTISKDRIAAAKDLPRSTTSVAASGHVAVESTTDKQLAALVAVHCIASAGGVVAERTVCKHRIGVGAGDTDSTTIRCSVV